MAMAQQPTLVAVILLLSSELHCSSLPPACPETCTCQSAPLVNCSSTGLSLVPQHIQDSVTELDLSHNLLNSASLLRAHRNLRNVWLGNNNITHLSLCIVVNLGSRYLRDKHLRRSKPWIRGCVSWAPTLQLLSVEKNQLEQLPEGLEGCNSLQVLQLSFNRISTLRPADLRNLPQLKELHLQHNLITSLPPQMFQDLSQLRVLDLSFNMLKSLHPLVYVSLHNIGSEVRLDGNKWHCDCSMRSLRRRMAYDNSRNLQIWRVLCASPSIHSDKDLLQIEEDDLNCLGTESVASLYQDVTVYSGSEALLSCSTQDPVWLTPSSQVFVSQPWIISDITERDTGLYVCVSEDHRIVSVFNLQISKIGGTRRNSRSLSSNEQITPLDIPSSMTLESNGHILALAVSVFITFLIAFILGVLARPYIDILWKRVINKKRSRATNSESTEEQRQYDNEAYSSGEEPGEIPTHRERRVTFSTVDIREDKNIHYYDTDAGGSCESSNNGVVVECEVAVENKNIDGDSGSENTLRHNMEFEHIPDPVELEERSLSSCSDSSVSDNVFKEQQITQRDRTITESVQLAKNSIQQRSDFSAATKIEVPKSSIEGTSEIPGFTSEPFAKWSPHATQKNSEEFELWQENEEQFEFSDSVRTTSARSSIVFDSFNDVVPTTDTQKRDDMSSSSSYVSENEPTKHTVNADLEEEQNIERSPKNGPEYSSSSDSSDSDYKPNSRVKKEWRKDEYTFKHDKQSNKTDRAERNTRDKALSLSSNSSSSSDNEDETTYLKDKPGRMNIPLQESPGISNNSEKLFPAVDLEHIPRIERHLDIKAALLGSDSSSSSDGEDETTGHTEKQRPGKVNIPYQESQTKTCDPDHKWPSLDIEHIPHIKRHLDFKAPPLPSQPSPDPFSSSDSDDEISSHMMKQRPVKLDNADLVNDRDTRWPILDFECLPHVKRRLDIKALTPTYDFTEIREVKIPQIEKHEEGKVQITKLPFQESKTKSQDVKSKWPVLDLERPARIKRRLDIKAPSPASGSSSSSDSEDEETNSIKKEEQGGIHMERLPAEISLIVRHEPESKWPVLNLEHPTCIKRRLDIKAPSPASASSSSSDSEVEITSHMGKQSSAKLDSAELPMNDRDARWPSVDFECLPRLKRRLDIKAPSPASGSSSSSDSEDEETNSIKKEEQGGIHMEMVPVEISQIVRHEPESKWPVLDLERPTRIKRRLDIKAPSPASDSSSSSDSKDEITSHMGKQSSAKLDSAELPMNDRDARWPSVDFECLPRLKRRLDIKAPSPASGSSSSSDSEDEETTTIKKQEQGGIHMERLPAEISQIVNHEPETQWPVLDLEQATKLKRRLDIKAPSPASDSSSSSDSKDEITSHMGKQSSAKLDSAELPMNDRDARWPSVDFECLPRLKRRLDIKAPSPASGSSSSSDSEDEETTTIKKQEQGGIHMERLPAEISQIVNHEPETQWPVLDLEQATKLKRRLDIKAPSPASDSSSSSDSEDKESTSIKKQEQGGIHKERLPAEISEIVNHEPETRWPVLDLTTRIKRRLDIKIFLPDADSSSSATEDQTGMIRPPLKTDISNLPLNDQDARWPSLDFEHIPHIKRRLDIKAPSQGSDFSSSSDSGNKIVHPTVRPEKVNTLELPLQKSEAICLDSETQWPAADFDNLTHVKRCLDIKGPPPPDDSLLGGGSKSHTVKENRGVTNKMSPYYSSSSSDEEEEGMDILSKPPDLDPRWPEVDLSSATTVKRRLDIKARKPSRGSSSSSDSDGETANLKVERDRSDNKDVGITNNEQQTTSDKLKLAIPHINRRLDIKASLPPELVPSSVSVGSQHSRSSSSSSDSENEKTKEKEFIKSSKTSLINLSIGPKKDPNITLQKYTVITDSSSSVSTNDSITPPKINPELQSKWATMNLGISRFRKRLEITSRAPRSSVSSENEGQSWGATSQLPVDTDKEASQIVSLSRSHEVERTDSVELKSETSRVAVESDSRWPQLSLTNIPTVKRALDIRAPLQRESSSSSNSEDEIIHHSVPDLSLGVPRIKRRLDIKAPFREQSDCPPSSSEDENKVERSIIKASRHMSETTGTESLITYKRLIMKAPSLPSTSQTMHQAEVVTVAEEGPSYSHTLGVSFDDIVKNRTGHSKSSTAGDLPPEIMWTGVSHHLSDPSVFSSRKNLAIDFSSPQQPTAATKFDNTTEISRALSDESRKMKGLSALKVMSSERRRWDAGDEASDLGPQPDTGFSYRRSEEDIKLLSKPPLKQLQLSSITSDERRARDLSYGIPRYRGHDTGDMEPPQEAPPPVPATPPPVEEN